MMGVGICFFGPLPLDPDFTCYLPNHYYLTRLNQDDCHIGYPIYDVQYPSRSPKTPIAIPPNITRLRCEDTVVYGERRREDNDGTPSGKSYFILETATDQKTLNLGRGRWENILETRYGVKEIDLLSRLRFFLKWKDERRQLVYEAKQIWKDKWEARVKDLPGGPIKGTFPHEGWAEWDDPGCIPSWLEP